MSNCRNCTGRDMCIGKDDKDTENGYCACFTPRRYNKPMSPYERTKAQVYATGNKWAIENFHATHD